MLPSLHNHAGGEKLAKPVGRCPGRDAAPVGREPSPKGDPALTVRPQESEPEQDPRSGGASPVRAGLRSLAALEAELGQARSIPLREEVHSTGKFGPGARPLSA